MRCPSWGGVFRCRAFRAHTGHVGPVPRRSLRDRRKGIPIDAGHVHHDGRYRCRHLRVVSSALCASRASSQASASQGSVAMMNRPCGSLISSIRARAARRSAAIRPAAETDRSILRSAAIVDRHARSHQSNRRHVPRRVGSLGRKTPRDIHWFSSSRVTPQARATSWIVQLFFIVRFLHPSHN